MGGFSIDGLTSGLDTTNIIRQLISLERNPQRRLQARQADLRNTVTNFTDLNARFKAVADAAKKLAAASDWQARRATSSNEDVASVTVTDGATPGSLRFSVDALAAAHSVVSDSTVAGKDAIVADGNDFTVNGVTITAAEYGGGSLQEVVDAINDADAGVTAVAVQVSPGNYRLQLAAEDTGAAGTFTVGGTGLSAAMGSFGVVTQGTDSQMTVGTGPSAYSVTSADNTFKDVMPGMTFTAHDIGTVTVTVAADVDAMADDVEALVKAMNDVQTFIKDRSTYNAETGASGVFLGQSLPRSLSAGMMNALIDPVTGASLVGAGVGIETDRAGAISFDRDKFIDAFNADPEAVEGFFTTNDVADTTDDGIAERLQNFADDATRLSTGRITSFIDGRKDQIDGLDDQIEAWDFRLEIKEAALRRQFTNLETVLGRLQSQGQWLAGALAGLPTPG